VRRDGIANAQEKAQAIRDRNDDSMYLSTPPAFDEFHGVEDAASRGFQRREQALCRDARGRQHAGFADEAVGRSPSLPGTSEKLSAPRAAERFFVFGAYTTPMPPRAMRSSKPITRAREIGSLRAFTQSFESVVRKKFHSHPAEGGPALHE